MSDVIEGMNLPDMSLGEFEQARDIKIGHSLKLLMSDGDYYFEVVNKEAVPWHEYTSSGWAVTAGSSSDIGSISDYLESGKNQLYVFGFGVYSDVNIEVVIRNVGTTGELYGIKQSSIGYMTPTSAPYDNPRFVVKSYQKDYVPSFKLRNNTKINAGIVKFSFIGWKFTLKKLDSKPSGAYTTLSLRHIGESGYA